MGLFHRNKDNDMSDASVPDVAGTDVAQAPAPATSNMNPQPTGPVVTEPTPETVDVKVGDVEVTVSYPGSHVTGSTAKDVPEGTPVPGF